MRLLIILLAVLTADRLRAQVPAPGLPTIDLTVEVTGALVGDFTSRMDAYARLRTTLEEGLPPLVVTEDPHDIRRAEQALAERIRAARAGAGRGDIFTQDIRRAFRQLLAPVTTEGTCAQIDDDNPGEFQYPVNSEYPKDRTVSTVPAAMLNILPRLPEDVFYRFLDTDLILHDTRANVILDRIDNAVRCR